MPGLKTLCHLERLLSSITFVDLPPELVSKIAVEVRDAWRPPHIRSPHKIYPGPFGGGPYDSLRVKFVDAAIIHHLPLSTITYRRSSTWGYLQ